MSTEQDQTSVVVQTEKRSLFWGMRWMAVALGFAYIIKLARGAVLPKLLPPHEYGLAISLLLPLTYLRYSDLGVMDQLIKRLPYFRGREGEEAFRRHVNLGAAWTLATAVIAAMGPIVASFWLSGPKADYYRTGLRLVAMVLVAQTLQNLLAVVLNAQEEFRHSQIATMLSDGSALVYSVVCVILWGPIGIVWAMLFTSLTVSFYLAAHAGMPRLSGALRPMLAMVREGLMLLWLSLTELLMFTLDQLFLLYFFSVSEYGLYMLGMALAAFFDGPRSVCDAAQPRIMSLTGRGRADEAKRIVASTLSLYGIIAAAMLAASVPAAAVALRFYLVRYQAGMGLYIVTPLVTIACGPLWLVRPYFLARNKERRLIFYESIGLVVIASLDALVVAFKGEVVEIALATLFGVVVMDVLALRDFEGSILELLKSVKRYAFYPAAVIGAMCIYGFWRATMAAEKVPINIMKLSLAAMVYGVGILVVAYLTRSEWLAAVKLIRAQPKPEERDLGIVLSEVVGDLPQRAS